MRSALLAGALILLPIPLAACLWDYDTLATEARGLPDVIRVITGRFERNPPLYYEMRLERAAKRVGIDDADLDAYDDAGVACDRLGKGDEAIAWMERKRAKLDELAQTQHPDSLRDHRYRYLANVGTFWVHRWARNGADRSKIAEVETARDFIAKAIELNPDAHFGRETYQLQALEWIIRPKPSEPPGSELLPFLDFDRPENVGDRTVRGLSGLIALGNAWESVDVFHTLSIALSRDGDRNSVSYLAMLRAEELIGDGRRSLQPDTPTDPEALKRLLRDSHQGQSRSAGPKDRTGVEAAFLALRRNADEWHEARTAFLLKRLGEGRHPDTDPSFWDGYREIPEIPLPDFDGGRSSITRLPHGRAAWRTAFEWMTFSALALCAGWLVWTRMIRARGKPPVPALRDEHDLMVGAARTIAAERESASSSRG